MLNPFPSLLVYGFFAPTLLRAAVAAALLYLAYQQWQRRHDIARVRMSGFPAISIAFNATLGVCLLVGYATQWAALFAIAGFAAGLWMNHRHPHIRIYPDPMVLVLATVCLSLLLSGAGAFAYDLPL